MNICKHNMIVILALTILSHCSCYKKISTSQNCNGQKHVAEGYIKSSGVASSRRLSPPRDDSTRLPSYLRNMLLPNTDLGLLFPV